ncbi:MAG: ATP-binding protein [Phycisphaerales bacterium]
MPSVVHSDPTRLRQIISNLIGNAIKFTARGEVRVAAVLVDGPEGEGRLLSITVADTGIGIPPASLTNLFQPFVQADATMSRRFGGSGLGLSISRTLARMLGGDIVAASEPGKGSTFTATVNAGIDQVSAQFMSGPVLPQAAGSGAVLRGKVLLAEDGPDNQRLFTHHLTRAGATVEVVPNGEQAVAKATSPAGGFDLILMDMQMPGTDGYEATRRLRAMGYEGPIVALTAHAMAADRERALSAGCDDYLTKPIARDALIRACQKWLNFAPQRKAA